MSVQHDDVSEIASRLNADCELIALYLLGEPNRRRTEREWRWGEHGRLRLHIAGPKAGKWSDFAAGGHGDMLDLIGRELGLDKRGAVDWAMDWLGGDIGDYPVLGKCAGAGPARVDSPAGAADPEADRRQKKARALEIWNEAVPVTGTLSAQYLTTERGLLLPKDILAADAFRHHGALCLDRKRVPGLVALMRDPVSAEPVGIQRTFLTPEGKKIERRMLGSAGVVMLSANDEVAEGLGLAEGMETALAVMTLCGWRPVWAAMSAAAIKKFPALGGVGSLTVFADPEVVGMEAARACARRWADAGREATILSPPRAGRDWNDELRGAA